MNRRGRPAVAAIVVMLALVVGAYGVKVVSMYASAHRAISAFWTADYPATIDAARGQEFLNWFEPYKAPFNIGVGYAASGAFEEARGRFTEALGLARGVEVCPVRFNLALTLERLGDDALTAGDARAARDHYLASLTLTRDTPEECRSDEASERSSDPTRSMSAARDASELRVEDKLRGAEEQPDEAESPPGGDEPPPTGDVGSDPDAPDTDPTAGGEGETDPTSGSSEGDANPTDGPAQADIDRLRERMEKGARERDGVLQRGQRGSSGRDQRAERPW